MRSIALARRNLVEVARDPLSAALGAVLPLGLLAIFLSIGKRTGFPLFSPARLVPGLAVFGLSFLLMFSAMLVARDRRLGMLDRISASPLGDPGILAGYAAAFLPLGAVQVLLCLALALPFGFRAGAAGLAALVLVLLVVAALHVAAGILIGLRCNENQIAGIGSLVLNVAGLLGGAWMDIDAIGGVLALVARVLPFKNATDVAIAAASRGGGALASPAFLVLAGWTALAATAAVLVSRRANRG